MRTRLVVPALIVTAFIAGCHKNPAANLPEPLSDAEKAELVATLPEPYHDADLVNGKARFAMCKSCHSIERGGKNLTGPNLYGVFGRQAGTEPGFIYSDAVKNAGFTWDADHLEGWLASPRNYLKGTKMSFAGLKDEKDRTDLIVWLMTETGYRTPEMKAKEKGDKDDD